MFIIYTCKEAQHGIKGLSILVPADFKKVQTILPRSYSEEYLISLCFISSVLSPNIYNSHVVTMV